MDAQSTNQQRLCDAVISTLTKLHEECFRRLFESASRRIKAVIKHPVRCSETLSLTLCDVREMMCDGHLGPCTNGTMKDSTNKNIEIWTKQAKFKVYKTIRNIYEKKNFNIRFGGFFIFKTCHLHYPECISNISGVNSPVLYSQARSLWLLQSYKKVWSAVFTPSWHLFKWHPQSFLWSYSFYTTYFFLIYAQVLPNIKDFDV